MRWMSRSLGVEVNLSIWRYGSIVGHTSAKIKLETVQDDARDNIKVASGDAFKVFMEPFK